MTGSRRPSRPASVDDDAIGMLVRDVASGWTMPPVRLDAPSWRDRVRGRRARAIDAARLALGRAGQAAMAAAALSVVAALVAVLITRPPQQPAGSPSPSGGATSGATSGPSSVVATPLPRLLLNGALPFPSRVLVADEVGDIALVDLANGTIGGSIARAQWPSGMAVSSTGLVMCVCITTADVVEGFPTTLEVRLKSFTRTTTPIRDDPVDVIVGTPDPREPATRLEHVLTSVAFSPDDRFAYVGWSARAGLVWRSRVLVVDIAAGSVATELRFADMTAGEGDARRRVAAPRVLGLTGDGTVLLARAWAEWGSANVDTTPVRSGDDAFTWAGGDGTATALVPLPDAARCGPSYARAGARPGGGFWVTCLIEGGALVLRRMAADGTSLGIESMSRTGFVDGDTTAVSPDGSTFYAWDPGSFGLTKIDLVTGTRTDERPVASSASADALSTIAHWLAPGADAKAILRGALLVSPDGRRLYVLATQPIADDLEPSGSAGILVVDEPTLQVIDHWPPAADFASMALSPDGRLLYAAGLPGVDASGAPSPGQGASVTVFDTATGDVQLVAGQLGGRMLTFPGAIVP